MMTSKFDSIFICFTIFAALVVKAKTQEISSPVVETVYGSVLGSYEISTSGELESNTCTT